MAADQELISFTRGLPAPEVFPRDRLAECIQDVMSEDWAVALQYGSMPLFTGHADLRQAIASEHSARPDDVLVGNGSLQLLDLLAQHLLSPGDIVLTEQPCYDRALTIFRRRGARTVGIPLEKDGLSLEHLQAAARQLAPKFLYLVPDFQNPTGVTLSSQKRREVLRLSERYQFKVIEDSPYRKLRYRGEELPSMRELGPETVIAVRSFSKLICPGVRVGYILAGPDVIRAVTKLGEDTYLTPSVLTQAAVARYLKRGWLGATIDVAINLYRTRWLVACETISRVVPNAHTEFPDGGFFIGLNLPTECRFRGLVERAKRVGLLLSPGEAFMADTIFTEEKQCQGERFLRIAFPAVTPPQLEEGLQRLARLL